MLIYTIEDLILVDKNIGQTPLQAIDQLRVVFPELKEIKMGYAGRLDPLASGLLLIMVGDGCKNRDQYQGLDKVYEFEFILGVSTASFDLLGLPVELKEIRKDSIRLVELALPHFTGKLRQTYPPFSSKTVKGKPLYSWAREGKLDRIELPVKEVTIYQLELLNTDTISSTQLLAIIKTRISLVTGDFRQQEIIEKWTQLLAGKDTHFPLYKMRATVSSGTYIRSIVNDIGAMLGFGATTLSIQRQSVGGYQLKDAIMLK